LKQSQFQTRYYIKTKHIFYIKTKKKNTKTGFSSIPYTDLPYLLWPKKHTIHCPIIDTATCSTFTSTI